MNRESAMSARALARRRAAESEKASIETLRAILVGPERQRLESLESRDVPSVDSLADKLPSAIETSHRHGPAISRALQPIVVDTVHTAVRRDPERFADALYPAIAPAIRRAIAAAMRDLMRKIEETFARRSAFANLRWRIEAARTGRTFAEVALVHSANYRVEQLLLVHRDSGLLLQHLVAPSIVAQDPAQVSAMLSAIDSFVNDAFRGDAHLEHFDLGELKCWIERGPSALLVAVVRGADPPEWASTLGRTLEAVHVTLREELSTFHGDTAAFDAARVLMEPLLSGHPRPTIPPRTRRALGAVALGALVVFAVTLLAYSMRAERAAAADSRLFERTRVALESVPGLVITSAEHRGRGDYRFTGLRDPGAQEPARVIARAGLPASHTELDFNPYLSLDPRMVRARVEPVLRPPSTVSWTLDDRVLRMRGTASTRWIDDARWAARALPGVDSVDLSEVHARGSSDAFAAASEALSSVVIPFRRDDASLSPHARDLIRTAAGHILALEVAASEAQTRVRVVVYGESDAPGTSLHNATLRSRRAAAVVDALTAAGVRRSELVIDSGGRSASPTPSVSFDVEASQEAAR